jgi:probable rRNA maturation factor
VVAGRSTRRTSSRTADDVVVEISDRERKLRPPAAWLGGVVRAALDAEGVAAAELSILIVDDRRIAAIHAEWLDDPAPTDVITFDLSRDGDPAVRGDIVVSAETAARVARVLARARAGWKPRHELAYYIVHGILHLTGHDDKTPRDRRAMRSRERAVMKAVGLPLPPRRPVRRRQRKQSS